MLLSYKLPVAFNFLGHSNVSSSTLNSSQISLKFALGYWNAEATGHFRPVSHCFLTITFVCSVVHWQHLAHIHNCWHSQLTLCYGGFWQARRVLTTSCQRGPICTNGQIDIYIYYEQYFSAIVQVIYEIIDTPNLFPTINMHAFIALSFANFHKNEQWHWTTFSFRSCELHEDVFHFGRTAASCDKLHHSWQSGQF